MNSFYIVVVVGSGAGGSPWRLRISPPADRPLSDGSGEVPKHDPQPRGMRPTVVEGRAKIPTPRSPLTESGWYFSHCSPPFLLHQPPTTSARRYTPSRHESHALATLPHPAYTGSAQVSDGSVGLEADATCSFAPDRAHHRRGRQDRRWD